MQSFWEDTLEVIFFHRGTQEEKYRQGPSFFFTAREHDELVLPGSPILSASLSCTDKALWQTQGE